MRFRIVFTGSTGHLTEIWEASREVNETAVRTYLGMICPDDCIEAEVNSVEEGKALMKHIYQKTKNFPKAYAYVDGEKFWSDRFKYIGHNVYSDRFCHEAAVEEEHFEDFLED